MKYELIIPKEELKYNMKQETLKEAATKEGLFRASQHNLNRAKAGYNAKWFKRGALFGAKWQAERMYSSLSKARNELYDKLPTGDVDAFELLKLIKIHLQKLDVLCGNK